MLTISSSAFEPDAAIPSRFTCDGANASPPLRWSGVPDGTRSLVLIVDDPDAPDPRAPKRIWVHWVLYNIPPTVTSLGEGRPRSPVPPGAGEGLNDSGQPGYEGPCPPIGRHRYFHKLFALDTLLPDLGASARRKDVEAAMAGHVLAYAEVMGTYARE